MRSSTRRATSAAAGVAFLVLTAACSPNTGAVADSTEQGVSAPYYQGKTLEIIVPSGVGGGTDAQARFLAPWLSQFIDGNPAVQVVNIEGGGQVLGSNEFALNREPDGTTALFTTGSTIFPYLLREPAVKIEYKDMRSVLGVPSGVVTYVSPRTGIRSATELRAANEPLVFGGISPTSLDALFVYGWDMLEVPVKTIFGYESRGATRLAVSQGDLNVEIQTVSGYRENVLPLVEAGEAIPLFTWGQLADGEVVRDPAWPDLPSFKEVYEVLHGQPPGGERWEIYKAMLVAGNANQKNLWVHGTAPREAVEALDKAVEEMSKDPDFRAEALEVLEYDVLYGPELQAAVDQMLTFDEGAADTILDFLADNGWIER